LPNKPVFGGLLAGHFDFTGAVLRVILPVRFYECDWYNKKASGGLKVPSGRDVV